MSELLGLDSRRVDDIAEGLRGHSQEIRDLRTIAQRAVAEMRDAWGGQDFERIAQRWEQEAGPRLMDVSSALSTMATVLRAQAQEQRQASGDTAGSSVPITSGTPGGLLGGHRAFGAGGTGGVASWDGDIAPWDSDVKLKPVGGESVIWGPNGEKVNEPKLTDHVKLNLAEGHVTLVDESLVSLTGQGDNFQYELAAGKVEADADASLDVDARGNIVASAGFSAAAYAGYAAGAVRGGNDFANATGAGKAYAGAEAKADGSGSFGPDGARGHLGAQVFAGVKFEGDVSATVAGVTAMTGAEISFGIGAHAEVDAEFSPTKVGISADIGAALGIGVGFKFDVSANPQEVIGNVGHAAEDVGEGVAFVSDQVASFFNW